MAWFAALSFAVISLGVGWFVYALTANLEPQPEYPTIMTDMMRLIGTLVALSAGICGAIMLGYAAILYVS